MSAIHTGRIDVRTVNGRLQFTGKSEDHAVPGWPKPAATTQVFIPKQRAGSAYETAVLASDGDDLADLGDFVWISQLGTFARELLADMQTATEV